MKTYKITTNKRTELLDITDILSEYVKEKKMENGSVFLHVPHTTAGVTINENADPDVKDDILKGLSVFDRDDYMHGEGNSSAHIKASLIGANLTVLIKDRKPVLGTWQGIMFCEFDGPRVRKVVLSWN